MTEVRQTKQRPTVESRLSSTVLLFAVPVLLLAIIGVLGGSFAVGTPELALLTVIWVVGLVWIWRPRRG